MDQADIEKLLCDSERQRQAIRQKLAETESHFRKLRDRLASINQQGFSTERENILLQWEESLHRREREHELNLAHLHELEMQILKVQDLQHERSVSLDERERKLLERDEAHWLVYFDDLARRQRGS